MVSSAIFITDLRGKSLIHRNFRGNVSLSITEEFQQLLIDTDSSDLKPVVINSIGITFCFIKHNDLYLLGIALNNANVMLILNFLYQIIAVFSDYFNVLEQESIRDNFVLIYELLDEMCDFGYPQHTDSKMLKQYICIEEKHRLELMHDLSKAKDVSASYTGKVSWRKNDGSIKYKKNEVFLDVIEKLNLLIDKNGRVIHSEIIGTVKMKSYLSGWPELKLGRNRKMVQMDDIRFHQCVRLARFESDRSISFIPPDGDFELMSYRLEQDVRPLIVVECQIERKGQSRIEFLIKVKSEFKRRSSANNVEINIPVAKDADTPVFKHSIGKVKYLPENNCMQWNIKQLNGQREFIMRASFGLPSVTLFSAGQTESEGKKEKPPISVQFEIPYFTVSGIQVRYLKIVEKSGYHALPWVRYITQNGNYEIRL